MIETLKVSLTQGNQQFNAHGLIPEHHFCTISVLGILQVRKLLHSFLFYCIGMANGLVH